jgi:hypothetical protein
MTAPYSLTKKAISVALGVIATAVTAPAVLALGAGSAQADTNVYITSTRFGADLKIFNLTTSDGSCTYKADPVNKPLPPYVSHRFELPGNGSKDLHVQGLPTDTQWMISITCDNGGSQATNVVNSPNPVTY